MSSSAVSASRPLRWLLFSIGSLCMALVFMEMTILPVALPAIQRQFSAAQDEANWIINAYSLAFSIFIIFSGKLGDLYGKRKIFFWGLLLFALSSIGCALSEYVVSLILGRFFLGLGISLMYPNIYSVVLHSFRKEQRGFVSGLMVAIGAIFLTAGPYLGGVFTNLYSWTYIFWINLPIALLIALFSAFAFPQTDRQNTSLDWKGFFLFTFGFSLVVLYIMQGNSWGWGSFSSLSCLLFGIFFLVYFAFTEKSQKHPYMDFSLFKSPLFINAVLGIFFAAITYLSTVYWPIYFQEVLGYSALKAGEVFMIANAPVLIAGPLGGLLLDRFSLKVPIFVGGLINVFAFVWMSYLGESISFMWMIPGLIALGLGNPMMGAPSIACGVASVPENKSGQASGIMGAARGVGSALGIALAGAILSNVRDRAFAKHLAMDPRTENLLPSSFSGLLTGVDRALYATKKLSSDVVDRVYDFMFIATVESFTWTYLIMAGFCVLLILLTLFLSNTRKRVRVLEQHKDSP